MLLGVLAVRGDLSLHWDGLSLGGQATLYPCGGYSPCDLTKETRVLKNFPSVTHYRRQSRSLLFRNRYIIKSDSGTFSEENKDEIYMVNVTAEINLKNGANIYLKSKNAIYNTINFHKLVV